MASFREVASGLRFPEGPVWLADGSLLVVEIANGTLTRVGSFLMLEVPASVTREAAPNMIGCTFYEAALRELLRLLIGGSGAVDHVRCRGRGEDTCEWRAEWRSIDLATAE